ncbi:MAG: nucleotide exchange factor GrpE [Sphaerobacteraceae bacterium]|nr:MAG: nucleotide exchange factor GrpE [Sphaerobacteraceae bacterium]
MRDPNTDEQTDNLNGTEEQDTSADEEVSEQTKTGSMEEELENERQRSAEYLDQAQRARAELVNYRRRTEEELARMQKLAGERILAKILPAIDDLDRAIKSMDAADRESSWGEGIILVQKKIWSMLESEGVSPIESLGKPFDPSVHEAISMQEGAGGATTVVQEFQRGFMLGDRVLRPAMVVVGSAEDAPATDSTNDEESDDTETRDDREER